MTSPPHDRGRAVRAQRARTLHELRTGALSAAQAVSEPPTALLNADLYQVLLSCKGLGRSRLRRVFEKTDVWPHKLMRELNERERSLLANELQK